MLGAAAVKDTYELLRDGIRKILSFMDKKTKSKINLSLKAYGKGDPKPKKRSTGKIRRSALSFFPYLFLMQEKCCQLLKLIKKI